MKTLLLVLLLGTAGLVGAATPSLAEGDKTNIAELFPNPGHQNGIRKVAGIVSQGGIGTVIIQWDASQVSDQKLKSRVAKLCSQQPNRSGKIEILQGFNDSTDETEDGRTIPTRSGMIECLMKE